ncbi:hypothetical protein [Streptomyces sp. NPDC048527]|uniref:hypothetical protein n=1 Tax=Streptomyces sp. NPDC048527 TaxID=3365568 RepID=UPI003710FB76
MIRHTATAPGRRVGSLSLNPGDPGAAGTVGLPARHSQPVRSHRRQTLPRRRAAAPPRRRAAAPPRRRAAAPGPVAPAVPST